MSQRDKKRPATRAQAPAGTGQVVIREGGARLGGPVKVEDKVSHAMQKLLDTQITDQTSDKEAGVMLDLLVYAWNISLAPAEKQPEMIQRIMDNVADYVPAETKQAMLTSLEQLVTAKAMLFPEEMRLLVYFKMVRRGDKRVVSGAAFNQPGWRPGGR